MLNRIALIVALVAGLAVAGLNFVKIKAVITDLRANLANETSEKQTALADAATAKKKQNAAEKELADTKTQLEDTTKQRDDAVANAETQTKRAARLSDDLTKSKQETSDAQAQLASWSALGLTADQVRPLIAELKQVKIERDSLVETNKDFLFQIDTLRNRLAKYEDPENYRVQLPASLHGKVIVADPKWDFVVLDFGSQQGAREDGVLLVSRSGKLVAKVQIRNVQPNRCIANVLTDWKLGDVMEGDLVVP